MTATVEQLQDEYDSPWEAVAEERRARKELEDTVEQQNETIEQQTETIHKERQARKELEDTVGELQARAQDDENDIAEMKERITDLEGEIEAQSGNVTGAHTRISELQETIEENPQGQTNIAETDTELEFLASLNPGMLDDETENKRRAVEIVAGLKKTVAAKSSKSGDYYRLTSKQLREGLDRLDENSHSQTVERTRDFIEDMAGDQARVDTRHGRLNLYIEKDLVKSVQSHRGDGGVGSTPPETTSGTS